MKKTNKSVRAKGCIKKASGCTRLTSGTSIYVGGDMTQILENLKNQEMQDQHNLASGEFRAIKASIDISSGTVPCVKPSRLSSPNLSDEIDLRGSEKAWI